MTNYFPKRKNMINQNGEVFKPPLLVSSPGISGKILDKIRLFLDLQSGSIWRDLSKILPFVSGTILDVGCGGSWYKKLFNLKQATYIGIDTIESKANFGYLHPETLYYSGKKLPVEDKTADFILCTETLEHILEPAWILEEMSRCLKKGGKILITVPFAARWHFIPYDYWRYTPSSLLHLLTQAGFTHIQVYARGNSLAVACYKSMSLMLPFLFSKPKSKITLGLHRLVGLIFLPFIFLLASIANIAIINTKDTEDCLGFTVLAEKLSSN